MRVVSVLPSATEIVCAIGRGKDLVARSSECDYPPSVRPLPAVMSPKTWDSDRSSREIDSRVRSARGQGESLYELDLALLKALAPDVLLTQDLCGVCSVTDREVEEACRVAGVAPRIVSLSPRTLVDVWESIESVGTAIGAADPARILADSLRRRSRSAKESSKKRRPSIAVVEWLDPPILAGLWTPEIVLAAGGQPLLSLPGGTGVRTTWTELQAERPDLVILSPCSFSVERTERELVDPVLNRQVRTLTPPLGTWIADEAYFSRPGPRLADGIDLVRNLLSGGPANAPMPVVPLSTTSEARA